MPEPKTEEKTYTREEVMRAVNAGADLVTANISSDHYEEYANATNVTVCMIGNLLDDPETSFEDAMGDSFQGSMDQWRSEFPDLDFEDVDCPNCDWSGPEDDLDEIIDLGQRVSGGEPMPAGQCPECGALCHPKED